MEIFKKFLKKSSEEPINKNLEALYLKFSKIFEYDSLNKQFENYLSTLQQPTNQVCAKKLINVGAWSCKDCEKDSSCIICMECYEKSKEKHIGHKIKYKTKVSGCCDCGDPDAWDPKGFCSEHMGTFNNDIDIENYVKSCFNDDIIEKIKSVIVEIVKNINAYFLDCENKDVIIGNLGFSNTLNNFLDFIYFICNANLGILHIVSEVFLKNFTNKTKHDCFSYKNDVLKMEKNNNEHDCICPFIKNLMSVWTSEINNEKILYLFLHNYKLKREIGLIYISILKRLIEYKADNLLNFSVQIMTDEVSIIISKHPNFLINVFDTILEVTKNNYSKEQFKHLSLVLFRFYCDIHYLIKSSTYKEIAKNVELFKKIIDIACIFHNFNSFKIAKSFQRDGWINLLVENDCHLIKLFELFISILDFNNISEVETILNYLVDNIINKKYKILDNDEYSFHITLIRLFSIFINKFSFSYSNSHNVDLLTSFNYIMSIIPNKTILNEILIKELFKFFGFFLSIELNFWIYYGENMNYFPYYYFNLDYPLIDITLFKYLVSLKENSIYLSIDKFLELCSVNNSHSDFMTYIYNSNDLSKENLKWCKDDKLNKNMKLNSKIIELFIKMLRDNTSMLILFMDPYLKLSNNKIKNEIMEYIIENEKENLLDIRKEKLIHYLISNQNLVTFSELKKNIYKFLIYDENEFTNSIDELTDKIKLQNQQIKFSIKNKYIKCFDINYIIDPKYISKAEKYLMDFKKDDFNITNTYFYNSISIEKSIDLNGYFNFFFTGKNLEFILQFYKALLKVESFSILHSSFLMLFTKYILILIYLMENDFNSSPLSKEEKYKYNYNYFDSLSLNFVSTLDQYELKDKTFKQFCQILKKKISKFFNINIQGSREENEKEKKDKKNDLKNKFKEKFKNKNKEFENKNKEAFKELELEEENNYNNLKDTCVYCRNNLDVNDYFNNPFVLLGMISNDKFIYNAIETNLKNEFNEKFKDKNYEKYYQDNLTKENFQNNNHIRLLTCSHKIHIKCHENFIIQNIYNDVQFFGCPLCKKTGNIIIPFLNDIKDKNLEKFFKGLSIEDIDLISQDKTKEDEILKDKFYLTEFDDNLFFNSMKNFLEKIFTIKSRKEILINDLLSKEEFENSYKILINEFHNFFFYYHLTSLKKYQIEIWGNLFLSLRILLKIKRIIFTSFLINRFIELINQLKNCEMTSHIIDNNIDLIFSELLFLSILLFEKGKFNFDKNIFGLFIIYIPFSLYIKSILYNNNLSFDKENIKNYITIKKYKRFLSNPSNNNFYENLKLTFTYIMNKISISKMISNNEFIEKENKFEYLLKDFYPELITLDSIILQYNSTLNNQEIQILKPNFTQEQLLTKLLEQFISTLDSFKETTLINKNLLFLGLKFQFSFIQLNKEMTSLVSKYHTIKCDNCQKIYSNSFICLICGKKFCNNINCKVGLASRNVYNIIYHSYICGGGNNVYLSLNDGEISYISETNLIYSHIYIYLSRFGDRVYDGKITNEYILNENELKKTMISFIDYSFRKYNKYHMDLLNNILNLNNINEDEEIEGDNDDEEFI